MTNVPRYHNLDLSKRVMHNVSRFCLHAHTLKVEAAAWLEGFSRVCNQCPSEDEHSSWYVCESDLGHSLLTARQGDGQSPVELAAGSNDKDVGGQRHYAFLVCHVRVWIGTPTIQLVLHGNAAVQLSN
jgi:hypothetical protein